MRRRGNVPILATTVPVVVLLDVERVCVFVRENESGIIK
jgi:hypothetical protein